MNKNHSGEAGSLLPPPSPAPGTEPSLLRGDSPCQAGQEDFSMKGAEEQLPLQGQGSEVHVLVFFLMSSRRLEGGRRRNKVCGNGHCFPECQLLCLCAVEARWGSRSLFFIGNFLMF